MDTEIIKMVLTEVLDELKAVRHLITEQGLATRAVYDKIESLEQQLSAQKPKVPEVDTLPIQAMINNGISQMKDIVASQPKTVVHQKRILFFPEYDAAGYYRLVFGRLLFWLMLFIGATYLFSLGRQGLEKWKEVRMREEASGQYKAAWEYLYGVEDKAGKKKLQKIWQEAGR